AFVLGGSLKSNLVVFSNFGTAYVTRFNDVPPSTGYGDPVQKLFKFDDNERVVGALSLDPRLPRPEKLLALSRRGYGLRFALAPPETTKGRKLELTTFRQEPVGRGGRGHQMVKRDTLKALSTGPVVQSLPEEKK